jgi:hypothetical protein
MATNRVILRSSDLPFRDPHATCDSCGQLGTIGRVVRLDEDGATLELHRFCRACWPSARTQFQAQNAEAMRRARDQMLANPGTHVDAASGFEIGGAS